MNQEAINKRIQALETELAGLKDELNKSDNISFKYTARECCFVGSSRVTTQMDGTDKSALMYFRYRQTEANANADLQLQKELMCIGALAEQIDPDYKSKIIWGTNACNYYIFFNNKIKKYETAYSNVMQLVGVVYMPRDVAIKVWEILNNKGVEL